MATVYGHFKYGEAVYGETSKATPLPPRTHLGQQQEDRVLIRGRGPEPPPETLPRAWPVYPHREGGAAE